jgi:uncharacterized protein (TIGR03000 family)
MLRPNWKSAIVGAVLVGALAAGPSQADAQGWWWGGWGYYSPACCYTPCYSDYYTPYYSVGYGTYWDTGGWYVGLRPGPIRRFLFGPYRWYYSPGASYASPWVSYAACCWDVACCGDVEAYLPAEESTGAPTLAPPKVRAKPGAKPSTGEPAGPSKSEVPSSEPTARGTPSETGLLSIRVPSDATVTINGLPTQSTGSHREYVSYGLRPGLTYKYEIRAQVVRNGQTIEDGRTVYLRSGASRHVTLDFRPEPDEEFATLWQAGAW